MVRRRYQKTAQVGGDERVPTSAGMLTRLSALAREPVKAALAGRCIPTPPQRGCRGGARRASRCDARLSALAVERHATPSVLKIFGIATRALGLLELLPRIVQRPALLFQRPFGIENGRGRPIRFCARTLLQLSRLRERVPGGLENVLALPLDCGRLAFGRGPGSSPRMRLRVFVWKVASPRHLRAKAWASQRDADHPTSGRRAKRPA